MNYKKESGRRLKVARQNMGWSLAGLSKKLGSLISPSRIGNYEQGTRAFGAKEALAFATVLKVEPSHLLCVETALEGEMTVQETELLRNFRALPEKDRNEYSRRIEALAFVYREPVPDERLSPDVRRGPLHRTKKTSV